MKYTKTFRILGIVVILTLLIVTMPVALAQAARSITLSSTKGKIGDTITIVGQGFNKSTPSTKKYVAIFFSSQKATTFDDIDDAVEAYEVVRRRARLDEKGSFKTTFNVPRELGDGENKEDVIAGTYYVYVCHYIGEIISPRIRAIAEFTVTVGEITIDADNGPVGTLVEITGTDFRSSKSITVEYDGSEVKVESGDDETDTDGKFVSYIIIPEGTAGVHTIAVTVSVNKVETEFTVEPEIIFDRTSGEANTMTTVRGTGFGSRKDVVIYFNNVGLAITTTDGHGTFTTYFTVPELEAGIYNVEAEDEDGNLDTAEFTIIVPPLPSAPPPVPLPAPPLPSAPPPVPSPAPSSTTASISQTSGHVGTKLIINGAGFQAVGTVTIKYDDEVVTKVSTDSRGVFVAYFKVPESKQGDHTITASDGTNTNEFTFTVESEAPPVPKPLLPEMGVELKPPLSFDWKDVTHDSFPVTYTLQIATSNDFSDASIVLEKKGLTKSNIFIEGETLQLASQKASYYWRIRAVDSASNEGEWTDAVQFYVAPSFTMPGWTISTLIGLGGVLLFSLGYWWYRRITG